jgi:hypothetical protein
MAMNVASVISALEELAGPAAAASALVREALLVEAKRGEAYAKSIAPVGDRVHTLKSGYRDEPGDYRDSIMGSVLFIHGAWRGRVSAGNFKAHWIEYGTKHMPKQSIMRRTAGHLRGTGE